MSEIKTVAVAGASGGVGSQVLKTLLADPSFQITALTQSSGKHTFPPSVAVKQVDYSSLDSLTSALSGQDAVINATNIHDPSAAKLLVDAAIAAGVRRYIPADFGMDPENAHIAALAVFGLKAAVYSYLKEKVASGAGGGRFSYTLVANGPFLDQNIRYKFLGLDLAGRKAELFDGGENLVPTTTVADVGKATANVMLHPDETKNRVVYVASAKLTQRKLFELAKEALGGEWTVEEVDIQKRFDEGMEQMRAGKFDMGVIMAQIQYATARKEYLSPWEKDDNGLLGVAEMGDGEIREMIKGLV